MSAGVKKLRQALAPTMHLTGRWRLPKDSWLCITLHKSQVCLSVEGLLPDLNNHVTRRLMLHQVEESPLRVGQPMLRMYKAVVNHLLPATPLNSQPTKRQCPPPPPCVTFRLVVASLRGPGQSPVLSFACCVGLLLSVGRCGRCFCWCRFRVCGAQWLVCWGCWCCFRVHGAQWLACCPPV